MFASIPRFTDEPESRGFGPRDSGEWAAEDPLREYYAAVEAFHPQAWYEAWSVFPLEARAAAWREREIAAYLYERESAWREILPNLQMVGVAWRRWKQLPFHPGYAYERKHLDRPLEVHALWQEYYTALDRDEPDFEQIWRLIQTLEHDDPYFQRTLPVGVLSFSPPWLPPDEVFLALNQAPVVPLPSRLVDLARFNLPPVLPLVIEPMQPLVPYSGFSYSQPASPTIQSGLRVEGPQYFGTLTTRVDCSGRDALLGAAHIFGGNGDDVKLNSSRIAQVSQVEGAWDAAVAEIVVNYTPDSDVYGLSLTPANAMPVCGLLRDVQFYGAKSGAHAGDAVFDQVYARPDPARLSWIGAMPGFTIKGTAKKGDSGALVLGGHGSGAALNPGTSNPNPALSQLYDQAMLGMLLAGPNDDSDANMPNTLFCRSIFELAVHMQLKFP